MVRPRQQWPIDRVAGRLYLRIAAALAGFRLACCADQPLCKCCNMFFFAGLVAIPPIARRVDDFTVLARAARHTQIDFEPRAIEQIF